MNDTSDSREELSAASQVFREMEWYRRSTEAASFQEIRTSITDVLPTEGRCQCSLWKRESKGEKSKVVRRLRRYY